MVVMCQRNEILSEGNSFMVLMVDWFSKLGLSRILERNLNQQMRLGRVQLLACPTVLAVLIVVGFGMQGL